MATNNTPARWGRLLSVRNAAEYLGIGIFTIRQWIWEGLLKPVPLPGSTIKDKKGKVRTKPQDRQMRKYLFDIRDLDALVDRLKSEGQ